MNISYLQQDSGGFLQIGIASIEDAFTCAASSLQFKRDLVARIGGQLDPHQLCTRLALGGRSLSMWRL